MGVSVSIRQYFAFLKAHKACNTNRFLTELFIQRSCDFYSKIPGAEVVLHVSGKVAILRVGDARIGLIGTGERRGFHLEVLTEHLDDMYNALNENGLKITGKPVVRPWGERTFILLDPDGYQLEFEEIEPGQKHV